MKSLVLLDLALKISSSAVRLISFFISAWSAAWSSSWKPPIQFPMPGLGVGKVNASLKTQEATPPTASNQPKSEWGKDVCVLLRLGGPATHDCGSRG